MPDVAPACTCQRGATVWLTGLPSAGKSTITHGCEPELRARGLRVEILDGDAVRPHLAAARGYSREDRAINIRRIGWVAELLARNGVLVLVSAIAPFRDVRDQVRAAHVAERRDRRDEDEDAVAGQQLRDPADPPDVDRPVVAGVAAGGGEVRPDRVAVEHLDPQTAGAQLRLAAVGDRRLARAGQAGEPDRRAALGGQGKGFLVGHRDSRRGDGDG